MRRHVKSERPVNQLTGLRVRSEPPPPASAGGVGKDLAAARKRVFDAVGGAPFKRGHVECPLCLGRLNFTTYRAAGGFGVSAKCMTKGCLDWTD